MMSLAEAVRSAVTAVCDPEYPGFTIEQLGIFETVRTDEATGTVAVELIPTVLGCPALDMIEADVRAAANSVSGVSKVEVVFRADPIWSPDRITPDARRRLATELAVAVRDRSGRTICPVCGSKSVVEQSMFGPTACRSIARCDDCRNPVEVVRR